MTDARPRLMGVVNVTPDSFSDGGLFLDPDAAIAHGITTNLITRSADVHLKERRPLILVPRETPLSLVHLENMLGVTRAGGIVLPAMPGWYHRPQTLDDLIGFIVARICDLLGVELAQVARWAVGSSPEPESSLESS